MRQTEYSQQQEAITCPGLEGTQVAVSVCSHPRNRAHQIGAGILKGGAVLFKLDSRRSPLMARDAPEAEKEGRLQGLAVVEMDRRMEHEGRGEARSTESGGRAGAHQPCIRADILHPILRGRSSGGRGVGAFISSLQALP